MVIDATLPTLVLLAVLVAAVVGSRLLAFAHDHRRAPRPVAGRPTVVAPARRCPRVVLIDDDSWSGSGLAA